MDPRTMTDKELSEYAYAAYLEVQVIGASKRSKEHRWLMRLRDEARNRMNSRTHRSPQVTGAQDEGERK